MVRKRALLGLLKYIDNTLLIPGLFHVLKGKNETYLQIISFQSHKLLKKPIIEILSSLSNSMAKRSGILQQSFF